MASVSLYIVFVFKHFVKFMQILHKNARQLVCVYFVRQSQGPPITTAKAPTTSDRFAFFKVSPQINGRPLR